jgi:hypothetical protein
LQKETSEWYLKKEGNKASKIDVLKKQKNDLDELIDK